jgi:hypothetical protein
MTKAKKKTSKTPRQQINNAEKLLRAIGVTNPQDGLNADADTADQFANDLNKFLQEGLKAKNHIKNMNRNPQDDYKAMGLRGIERYDTVEEFAACMPPFAVAEVFMSAKIQTMYMDKPIELREGDRMCFTPGAYKNIQDMKPCLKPIDGVTFEKIYKKYNGENLSGKTLFIWRDGGIGDLMFIRPIMCYLKDKYPTCKIIFATRERYHPIINEWDDCIDELFDSPFSIDDTLLRSDYHATFQGVIEYCADAERMDVHELFARHMGLDHEKINWVRPMSVVMNNPFFQINTEKYVVVQPRASSPVRTPMLGTIVNAINECTKLGYRVVVCDSPRYSRMIEDIISLCAEKDRIINFSKVAGDMADVVGLIDGAAFVIAPDSAFTHIAAMQDKPSIALYGPFPAEVRTRFYERCIVIETPRTKVCKFGGRECYKHSPSVCELGCICWHNIDEGLLKDSIQKLHVILTEEK